jgi:hypothetical protein
LTHRLNKCIMVITKQQAIEQLRPLIGSLEEIPYGWDPFSSEEDDKYILQWVNNPDNKWCSGKKYDFKLMSETEYEVGLYATLVLLVLGVRVK